ncbi:MAG: DUF4058 family protein [Gemmataceae bacterium]|nr:DUF4058 family protein [Gemmataceae bacterium]
MPLLDHFHPPLNRERHWEGFHSLWTSELVRQLNRSVLPSDYVAEPTIKIGVEVEVDVATLEEGKRSSVDSNGGVMTEVYAPPKPALSFPVDFAGLQTFEIKVQKEEGGLRLVAAIELVSPGNKDRPATRQAFVRKCATYLQEGISVIIVDIVTERSANLHADLMEALNASVKNPVDQPRQLYGVAYRSLIGRDEARVDAWPQALALGKPLPTLPLWLDVDLAVPVDLDEAYRASCATLRIPNH